jgi:hypothetical protein
VSLTRRKCIAVAHCDGRGDRGLLAALGRSHAVVALTAAEPPWPAIDGVQWRACDPFSLRDTELGLQDTAVAIYLGRGSGPATRLTQGSVDDFDLLCADNCARAARAMGVRLLVLRAERQPLAAVGRESPQEPDHDEVSQALASSGVQLVTVWLGQEGSATAASQAALEPWEELLAVVGAAHEGPHAGEAEDRDRADSSLGAASDEARPPGRPGRAPQGVRSAQRLALPRGRDARWLADEYLRWLPRYLGSLVHVEIGPTRACRFTLPLVRAALLVLEFVADQSTEDRQLFHVTGGVLARAADGARPRLEFRTVLGGRLALAVLHDFVPRLPWLLYRATQAPLHARVMAGFARHLAALSAEEREQARA